MHELGVIERLFDICTRNAQANNATKIISVSLKIGEGSNLQEEWIQRYFDYLCEGTIAQGAKLIIERIPLMVKCKECLEEFHVDLRKTERALCPKCSGTKFELISGREYMVDSMEIV